MGLYAVGTSEVDYDSVLDAAQPPSQLGNLMVLSEAIEASCLGNTTSPFYLSDAQLPLAFEVMGQASGFVPRDSALWPRVADWNALTTGGIKRTAPVVPRSSDGLAVREGITAVSPPFPLERSCRRSHKNLTPYQPNEINCMCRPLPERCT